MKKTWKYPVCYSIKVLETGEEMLIQTQLYRIGVYVIFDNNPRTQGGITPKQAEAGWKYALKNKRDGKIEIVGTGRIIEVEEGPEGVFREVI
jgi:hypothetical protein